MATDTTHLNHRVRWTYDEPGKGTPHCLECDVPVPPIIRTCPRCSTTFDGTGIGAPLEARILCADCTVQLLDERREADLTAEIERLRAVL